MPFELAAQLLVQRGGVVQGLTAAGSSGPRSAELVGNAPAASLRLTDHLMELIELGLLGCELAL